MKHQSYFDLWYKHVFGWEGSHLNQIVYVDLDRVATNHGIRETTWNMLAPRVLGISRHNLYATFRNMKPEWHVAIAKFYWNLGGGAKFEDGRVAAFFAEVVWGGGLGAIKHYQRWYNHKYNGNLKVDGAIGSRTSAAFNRLNQDRLFKDLIAQMYVRYDNLVAATPALEKNLKGWRNRTADFQNKFEKLKKKVCVRCPHCSELLQLLPLS